MHSQFLLYALIWAVVFTFLIAVLWQRRNQGVGITPTYLVFFAIAYWLQGATYALPWHEPMYPPDLILAGFQLSLVALVAFTIGVVIVMPFLTDFHSKLTSSHRARKSTKQVNRRMLYTLTWIYIFTGFFTYLLLSFLLGDVPTLGAFLSGIQRLYHIGILFLIWLMFKHSQLGVIRLLIIGLLIVIWPLFTMSRDGFLGFGLMPITLLFMFPLFRFANLKLLVLLSPVMIFIAMSIIMTYFVNRNTVRSVAWNSVDTETRINTVTNVFTNNFQAFNILDPEQLAIIDVRFALNWLTGRGIERIESGIEKFANGETIRDAFLMILPRFLWPDKPLVVGGQALVNKYTGVSMYGGTSVALGQVLEFYVNFGVIGVIGGFMVLGVVFSFIDRRVSTLLHENNLLQAAVWIVPCFGLWLVEDNLITVIGSAVSAVIALIVFNLGVQVVFAIGQRENTQTIPPQPKYEGLR